MLFESDILKTVFDELRNYKQAQTYTSYLFKDLVDNKFDLEAIS